MTLHGSAWHGYQLCVRTIIIICLKRWLNKAKEITIRIMIREVAESDALKHRTFTVKQLHVLSTESRVMRKVLYTWEQKKNAGDPKQWV